MSRVPASIPGVKTLSQVAAGVLATIAMLLFPALALAQDVPTAPQPAAQAAQAPGDDGGGGPAPAGPARPRSSSRSRASRAARRRSATGSTAVGTVTPFVAAPEGRAAPRQPAATRCAKRNRYVRQVKGKKLRPRQAALEAAARARPLPRPGQQAGDRPADRRQREVEQVRAQVHRPRPGRPRPGGRALQRPPARAGLLRHRQAPLRLAHRARGDGLPQGQRDGADLQRQPDDLQAARRGQGRLPDRNTPAPASTSRSTSPSR